MGVLPGIGGLIGTGGPGFGTYLVAQQQAGSSSSISIAAAPTPNEHESRIIAAFISHEGSRTLSSFQVNRVSATRYTATSSTGSAPFVLASIALFDFPVGTEADFTTNFSGNVSSAAHVSVFELVGVTRTGLLSATAQTESGTGRWFSGPDYTAGGMALTMITSSLWPSMGGTPQHAPIQLAAGGINGAYTYRAGLLLPTASETNQTFGTAGADPGKYAVSVVTLPPM